MTAVRETIIAAVEAALGTATSAAEIERMPSGDPARFPALHVHDDGQRKIDAEAFASRFVLDLSVDGFVAAAGGAAAHAQLNQLHADTVRGVMALESSNALIESVEEGDLRVAVAPMADKRRLAFSQDFAITFVTRRGEPESSS